MLEKLLLLLGCRISSSRRSEGTVFVGGSDLRRSCRSSFALVGGGFRGFGGGWIDGDGVGVGHCAADRRGKWEREREGGVGEKEGSVEARRSAAFDFTQFDYDSYIGLNFHSRSIVEKRL